MTCPVQTCAVQGSIPRLGTQECSYTPVFHCAELCAPNPRIVQGSTILSRRTYNEKVKPFPKGKWVQCGNTPLKAKTG